MTPTEVLPNGTPVYDGIVWFDETPPLQREALNKFMVGQTTPLLKGTTNTHYAIYVWDYKRFIADDHSFVD